MMCVALSYDHRLVDGTQAARFPVRVKERLEDPMRLLVERMRAGMSVCRRWDVTRVVRVAKRPFTAIIS
jgi:hypothetical protein